MKTRGVERMGGNPLMRGAPRDAVHAFQIMRVDSRFNRKKVVIKGATSSYEVVEWRIKDEE